MQVSVYNMNGEVVGNLELSESIFGVPVNMAVMHQSVVRQLANARQGTADTKTRGEIVGGGAKPYRQKGTGRARQGTVTAPHYKGGGVVFGPHPRSYAQDLPKKMRRLALKSALSAKVLDQEIWVLQELSIPAPRTREMVEVLENLKIDATALIVTADGDTNVVKSARNIPGVKTARAADLNIVDVLSYKNLIISVDAVKKVEETFGGTTA